MRTIVFVMYREPTITDSSGHATCSLQFQRDRVSATFSELCIHFPIVNVTPSLRSMPSSLSLFVYVNATPFLRHPFRNRPNADYLVQRNFMTLYLRLRATNTRARDHRSRASG